MKLGTAGLMAAIVWGCAWEARAQLSPGPLSQPHAHLEGSANCLKCHDPARGVSPPKCLSCHGLLAHRIKEGKGLHAGAAYQACEKCHVEHHGREFQLIYWGKGGRGTFNHRDTGFVLEGKHARLSCESCHPARATLDRRTLEAGGANPARTFLGLGTACHACHQDPHKGQFGDASCQTCHTQEAWKPPTGFRHDRTAFPLTGRHAGVACQKCHAEGRFKGIAFASCGSCHKDPHDGRLGGNCASCHSTDGWGRVNRSGFDHDRTRYPLKGRHARLSCESCHTAGRSRRMAFARCTDCHADRHAGQLARRADGGRCESCHDLNGFTPARFSVEDHKSYPLVGAHLAVPCDACHRLVPVERLRTLGLAPGEGRSGLTEQLRFPSTRCTECHGDAHRGQVDRFVREGGCESCHSVQAWAVVTFDHDRTNFHISGAHRSLACAQCHRNRASTLAFLRLPSLCGSCHQDPHRGQFAKAGAPPACERCHTENAWAAIRFDHDRDASFRLEGAHRQVPCGGCHKPEMKDGVTFVRYKGLQATSCRDCHSTTHLRPAVPGHLRGADPPRPRAGRNG